MKKSIIPYLLALGTLFSGVACSDFFITEETVDDPAVVQESGLITITASLEPSTKTSLSQLGGPNRVTWSAGDKIKIFNSQTPNGKVFILKEGGEGQLSAPFQGEPLNGGGPFYAVYPADAAVSLSGSTVNVTIPAVQSYAEGSFGNGANIAAVKVDYLSDFVFQNLCGVIRFPIKGSKSVQKINVYTNGDELLNGSGTVSFSGNGPSLTFTDGQTDESFRMLTLDCGSGVALSNGTDGTSFYMVVPAGTLSDGFTIEIIDTEEKGMLASKGSEADFIQRSRIRPMAPLAYSQVYKADFLLSEYLAAAFTGVKTSGTLSAPCFFSKDSGQYSYKTDQTSRIVRIQNWDGGYALTLTAPGTLNVGNSNVTVSATSQGTTGISSQSGLDVIKEFGKRVWLANDSGAGFIILKED